MDKNFKEILNETYDLFKSQGVSILGKGYEEVASDPVLFESYVSSLTEGVADVSSREAIAAIMTNTNKQILTESLAGIQPIASLCGPMIRKLWPSFALKNAVKTEVATSPSFVINYMKPYFEDANGNRTYVFNGVKNAYGQHPGDLEGDNFITYTCAKAACVGQTAEINFKNADGSVQAGFSGKRKNCALDVDLALVSLKADSDATVVRIAKKLGIERVIVYDYSLPADAANSLAAETGTVLLRADLVTGKVLLTVVSSLGANSRVSNIVMRAHYSSEFNENSVSWGLDTARETIQIGTGEHFNAPVTVEMINDLNALYQLDGTKELTDVMTNAFAYRTDRHIYGFLKQSFANQPKAGEFGDYPSAADYLAVFDVKPAAGFAGGPKAWREELKPVIDHLAARIKNATHLGQGMFNIVGNPLDIQLITNVDWKFRGGQGSVDGVSVNYSLGSYYGSYTYKIVSTEIVDQGFLYIVFIPEGNTQMTYNYWAYTFATELGYRDPQHPYVPSLMMTKRDVLHEFMPAIAAIRILGNDGGAGYDIYRDYIPTLGVSQAAAGATQADQVKTAVANDGINVKGPAGQVDEALQ